MRLWEHIFGWLTQSPERRISEQDAGMTFEEIAVYAEAFGKNLTGEKCCAIVCKSELAGAVALLSCFAAGVTAVPVAYRYGDKLAKRVLHTVDPTCVISDTDGTLAVYRLTDSRYEEPDPHPALIMCTSGTTGTPKGVMLSESNIICNVRDICGYFRIGGNDTVLISRPLYHAAVLTGEFLTAIRQGADIRFYSGEYNPLNLLRLIEQYRITTLCQTPTLWDLLCLCTQGKRLPLRNLVVSGECLSGRVAKRLRNAFPGAKIYHVYGMTEASPRISCLPPDAFDGKNTSVGLPLDSVRCKVVDEYERELPPMRDGMLLVSGPNVMLGYFKDPALTKRVLKDGWLHTGDTACRDENGNLLIKGRRDEMINRAGMNIYPQEIEALLMEDRRTREAYVYQLRDFGLGVRLGLMIAGNFRSVDSVRNLCKKVLSPYQMPNEIRIVEEVPRNGFGKVIRGGEHD